MAREVKGEVRLIMNGEVVRFRPFHSVKHRRRIIEEWTKDVNRLTNKHQYFISIILNT
jgi:hypothetical protein